MRADKNDAEAEKKAAAAFYPKNLTHAGGARRFTALD